VLESYDKDSCYVKENYSLSTSDSTSHYTVSVTLPRCLRLIILHIVCPKSLLVTFITAAGHFTNYEQLTQQQ